MKKSLLFVLLTVLVIAGCGTPEPTTPPSEPEATATVSTDETENTPEITEETSEPEVEPTATTPPFASDGPINFTTDTSDGITLSGIVHGPASSQTVVILAPQYPGEQAGWLPFANAAAEAGIRSVTFDLRGYGESGGERNDLNIPTDIEAVISFVENELAPTNIVLIGAVQSGTGAAKVAANGTIDGLVVLSAPRTTAANGLEVSDSELAAIQVPSLWISARQDLLQNIEALYEVAGSADKEIWIYETSAVPGTELFNGLDAADLESRLLEFINQF